MKTFWNPDAIRAACAGAWVIRPPQIALPPDRPADLPLPPLHAPITGLGTDTRSLRPGQVFLALRGPRFDGHEFLEDAVRAGSPILIIDDAARVPERGFEPAVGVLKVQDTGKALLKLAAAYRKSLDRTKVIAVCGSNGKTTTTRLIDHILRQHLRGTASQKSFNNAVGVPLTILSAKENDQYLVCEVGTNAPGEIAQLAEIVSPDIAVITSIGREHLELLTDLAGVAREEAAILPFVRPKGTAIIPADPPAIGAELAEMARRVPVVVTFGRSESANLRVTRSRHVVDGARVSVAFQINARQDARVPLIGEHNALNAVAAIAVARRVGIDEQKAIAALAGAQPADMRLNLLEITAPTPATPAAAPVRVLNDCYNANPDSMLAGVHSVVALRAALPGVRRVVLVLGEMLELGAASEREHVDLAAHIAPLLRPALAPALAAPAAQPAPAIDHITLVGPGMRPAFDHLRALGLPDDPAALAWHPDSTPAHAGAIAASIRPGDLVLLKGSRGVRLERVLEALHPGAASTPARAGTAPTNAALASAATPPTPAEPNPAIKADTIAEPRPDIRAQAAHPRNAAGPIGAPGSSTGPASPRRVSSFTP